MARRQRKNGNGRHLQTSMGAVRADLDALRKDMRGLMMDASDVATREVRGAVREAAGRVETWSSENIASVRSAVRSQPLKACAISIGAGAILGALLLR